MCGQVYSDRRNKEYSELPFEIVKQQLIQTDQVESVYLFGGEPFLYHHIIELMEFLKSRNIKMLTTTNGVLLEEFIESIVQNDFYDISISVDSHIKNDFEKIRGRGIFEKVLANIDLLFVVKGKYGNTYPLIGINCVVTKENYSYLTKFYDYVISRYPKIDRINFEAPIFVSDQLGMTYQDTMKKAFGCYAYSWRWFCNKVTSFNENELQIIYEQIQVLKDSPKVTFLLPSVKESFFDFFKCVPYKEKKTCLFPLSSCSILPNGDVTFCVDFPDYIIGNIKEDSLLSIWNGEKAEAYRKYLQTNGYLPICSRCPRIFNKNNSIL